MAWHKRRRAEIREWWRELKATRYCEICNEPAPECLHFHHRDPNQKEITLGDFSRWGWSKERLLAEVAKCSVLCANCHLKHHWDEGAVVGVARLELATSWSQTKRATNCATPRTASDTWSGAISQALPRKARKHKHAHSIECGRQTIGDPALLLASGFVSRFVGGLGTSDSNPLTPTTARLARGARSAHAIGSCPRLQRPRTGTLEVATAFEEALR